MMTTSNDYDHSLDFNSNFENVMMFDCADNGDFPTQIQSIDNAYDNMR